MEVGKREKEGDVEKKKKKKRWGLVVSSMKTFFCLKLKDLT